MRKFGLVLILLLLNACKQQKSNSINNRSDTVLKKVIVTKKLIKDTIPKAGYMDQDSIRINGKLKFIDTYKHAVRLFGKPDSIIKPIWANVSNSYYDRDFNYCYFNAFRFEKYKDSIVLRNVDFKPGVHLGYSDFDFNNSVTLKMISRKFPHLILDTLGGTDLDKRISVSAYVSKDGDPSTKWVLTFDYRTERLLKIDYWIDD